MVEPGASVTSRDWVHGNSAQSLPPGMMLPVQALTAGFVHAALSPQLPEDAAITAMPATPAVAADSMAAASMASHAAALAESLAGLAGATPATAVLAGQPAPASAAAVALGAHSRQGVFVGNIGLMLTYEDSSELTEVPDLYYLPNAPAWVLGLANLHGNLVPVFDLLAYLAVGQDADLASTAQQAERGRQMLLVLGHGSDAAGIMINGIPQRLLPTKQQQTDTDTAPALLLPHIQEAYVIDGQLWFDLDCGSLLSTLEQGMTKQA